MFAEARANTGIIIVTYKKYIKYFNGGFSKYILKSYTSHGQWCLTEEGSSQNLAWKVPTALNK